MTQTQKAKRKEHYVDNKKFLQAMTDWRLKYDKAMKAKRKAPKVTNYIGECFLKIANHLSYRPNFINYTYRDDMISDGIENCLQYMNNFNPKKSNNPFAYFTQIIYYAFIRRIQKEKKQQDVKAKEKMKPALSAEEMEKIYRLADQMDQMQQVDQRESAWTEQDLIDLFGKKTLH